MKCPHTNTEIDDIAVYIRNNYKKNNLSIDEFKILIYKHNFPTLINYNKIYELYVEDGYSLPDFKKHFGLTYHTTNFLIKYFNIPKRTHSQSIKESANKRKNTCVERYGVENPSQVEIVKFKKANTFTKNYGVNNIWKTEEFKNKLDDYFLKKYDMTMPEHRSMKSKEIWKSKTKKEKESWLDASIRSEKALESRSRVGYNTSKIETRVSDILDFCDIEHTRQFNIKFGKNKRRCYDIHITNSNILIEINGDYWHANPNIYNEKDVLLFRFGEVSAKDIWNKDEFKKQLAVDNGYKVIYVWEQEMKKVNNEELARIIRDRIDR